MIENYCIYLGMRHNPHTSTSVKSIAFFFSPKSKQHFPLLQNTIISQKKGRFLAALCVHLLRLAGKKKNRKNSNKTRTFKSFNVKNCQSVERTDIQNNAEKDYGKYKKRGSHGENRKCMERPVGQN